MFKLIALFLASLTLTISCAQQPLPQPTNSASNIPIVIGYSSWPGWWPWAIAEAEGLFAKNGANVVLKFFDSYLESLEAFASGTTDGNTQTLNDTVSFSADAVNGMVAVLVNDNSAGNDKIIAAPEIQVIKSDSKEEIDLKGKTVAIEGGTVDHFLLILALEKAGMTKEEMGSVKILDLETGSAAAAFATGQADAVGAFPPFWLDALKREGAHELISSAAFPGAIPDLLVVSQKLIDEQPDQVQALVNTWWDIREFMENNPVRAEEIMYSLLINRGINITLEDMRLFKEGTRFFTVEENLEAFSPGEGMKYMPYAAEKMTEFMLDVGFIQEKPDLEAIFDDQFIKEYAKEN